MEVPVFHFLNPKMKPVFNLGEGTAVNASWLRDEMKIRTAKVMGKPNPELNKYFKKNGTLNQRGIKALTEVV